jgi:hypothetical protein
MCGATGDVGFGPIAGFLTVRFAVPGFAAGALNESNVTAQVSRKELTVC